MRLTGHKRRAIFDRDNIIHEQELLDAGDQLVASLAQHAQAMPRLNNPGGGGFSADKWGARHVTIDTRHRVVGAGRWGRRARRLDRRHNPGRARPAHRHAHSRPTARDPAAAATHPPHRHGGRQWPDPGALACDGGRCRPERRSPPTVPELRRGFGTSGRSRPHVCAGPADEANRQDPHLPMRERVGTPAA